MRKNRGRTHKCITVAGAMDWIASFVCLVTCVSATAALWDIARSLSELKGREFISYSQSSAFWSIAESLKGLKRLPDDE